MYIGNLISYKNTNSQIIHKSLMGKHHFKTKGIGSNKYWLGINSRTKFHNQKKSIFVKKVAKKLFLIKHLFKGSDPKKKPLFKQVFFRYRFFKRNWKKNLYFAQKNINKTTWHSRYKVKDKTLFCTFTESKEESIKFQKNMFIDFQYRSFFYTKALLEKSKFNKKTLKVYGLPAVKSNIFKLTFVNSNFSKTFSRLSQKNSYYKSGQSVLFLAKQVAALTAAAKIKFEKKKKKNVIKNNISI